MDWRALLKAARRRGMPLEAAILLPAGRSPFSELLVLGPPP